MNKENKIKAALAQTHMFWEDKAKNYEKAEEWVREAAAHQAEAVFFPEMSFTGFSMNTEITKEDGEQTLQYMQALARQHQISIGFGWVKDCIKECGKCENHYTVVDGAGSVLSDYAKIHPFSYAGEDLKFQGGSTHTEFALNGIPCSSLICYDLRFPEVFQAVSEIAHVIIIPANWPAKRSMHWKTLLQARAIENQVYILAVNCVGDIGGVWYTGDSCVIDPDGNVQSCLSGQEGMIYFELADDVERLRAAFPVKKDRRAELYAKFSGF